MATRTERQFQFGGGTGQNPSQTNTQNPATDETTPSQSGSGNGSGSVPASGDPGSNQNQFQQPQSQLNVADLYQPDVPAAQGQATDANAAQAPLTLGQAAQIADRADANASAVGSQGFQSVQGQVNPESLVQNQLTEITRQSSPLMSLARQAGVLSAARRGLQNSSLAAGAAQAEVTRQALPIAQQDAAAQFSQQQANQQREQQARQFGANAANVASQQQSAQETQVSLSNAEQYNAIAARNATMLQEMQQFNAGESNRLSAFNAEMATQISEANAARRTAVSQGNAQEANRQTQFIIGMNQELNKQLLAGEQALDLANIQGRYNQLISTNAAAAQMWDSYFNSLAEAMSNPAIKPGRLASYMKVQQGQLEAGLQLLDTINTVDLSNWSGLPGIVSGSSSEIGLAP